MRALPFGFPKLLVSRSRPAMCGPTSISATSACSTRGRFRRHQSDQRNGAAECRISDRRHGARAAATAPSTGKSASLIAATMFGVTTPLVENAVACCNPLAIPWWHSMPPDRRTQHGLADRRWPVSRRARPYPTEWADEVVGGTLSAGPTRMEAAARAGIPQVIAPGALDMVNFGGAGGLPAGSRAAAFIATTRT